MGIDGKILDPICRKPDDPHHRSVLAHMRGLGEPSLSMFSSGK